MDNLGIGISILISAGDYSVLKCSYQLWVSSSRQSNQGMKPSKLSAEVKNM
jgi:hypothetical protein